MKKLYTRLILKILGTYEVGNRFARDNINDIILTNSRFSESKIKTEIRMNSFKIC